MSTARAKGPAPAPPVAVNQGSSMISTGHVNWNYPTQIWFGAGRFRDLPKACLELGFHRPLIVIDGALAAIEPVTKASDLIQWVGLEAATVSNFRPDPTD